MSASPEASPLRRYQAAFAARIRDPRGQPRPAKVPARRMRVYEDLLFNNLEGFLLACFPVTRKLLGKRAWRGVVRRFFKDHRCTSPLFRDIAGEFLAWIEPQAGPLFPDRPYLRELMDYEWLELSVSVSPAEAHPANIDHDPDLLFGRPVLNPTARLVHYQYPVHRIGPRFKPVAPDPNGFWYLVYRDRDEAVRFMLLNPVAARLIELLRDAQITDYQCMVRVAGELNHRSPELVVDMGLALLAKLRRAGAIL